MLEELIIHNYVLIDSLSLSFGPGLTVFSGETGTGKSILAGALSLLFGAKGDSELIRKGSGEASVSGRFLIPEAHPASHWLEERGISKEDGIILIRRTLKANGRGSITLQSTPVTRADLSELTSSIVDIHSQHEHQSLFSAESQRMLLDRYANIDARVECFSKQFKQISELRESYETLVQQEVEREKEIVYLTHAITEIQNAELKAQEEEELEQHIKTLSQHERLAELMESLYKLIAGHQSDNLRVLLKRVTQSLEELVSIDATLKESAERFSNVFFECEDLFEEILRYRSKLAFDPRRLSECEERLSEIRRLERKYGKSIEEVLAFLETSLATLRRLENLESEKNTLYTELVTQEKELANEAREISQVRQKAAKKLSSAVREVLKKLGMPKSRFEILCTERKNQKGNLSCNASGIDVIAYHIAVNPGEDLKPLRQVASGGELSRIMLALKTVFADSDTMRVLVFDEVDTGIGGEVGLQVGRHLSELATQKQVLSITHLASIASFADTQIRIEKEEQQSRTLVRADVLDAEQRINEIARMLAGDQSENTSLEHAKNLLSQRSKSWQRSIA